MSRYLETIEMIVMKNTRLFILLLTMGIVTIGNTGCKDEVCGDLTGDLEYFVFGHFYGECAGEGCVEMFKVEEGKLYEDDIDDYPNYTSPIEAHWNELPAEKYNEVKNLSGEVPMELFDETDHVLGIPDGGDWGGIYVEFKYSGSQSSKSGFWLLDKNENNMAQVYNDFVDKIEEKITVIQ